MAEQIRVWKVLLVLLLSMTSGAVILMALGNNAPSAGAFCLSSYYNLLPAEAALSSRTHQSPNRWERIEVFYSGTRVGDIAWLTSLSGLNSVKDLNCHFVVCNGQGGEDGEIQTTEKWQKQLSTRPSKNWYSPTKTIRICMIADTKLSYPTDYQLKRVEALIKSLTRRFGIQQDHIHYPGDSAG